MVKERLSEVGFASLCACGAFLFPGTPTPAQASLTDGPAKIELRRPSASMRFGSAVKSGHDDLDTDDEDVYLSLSRAEWSDEAEADGAAVKRMKLAPTGVTSEEDLIDWDTHISAPADDIVAAGWGFGNVVEHSGLPVISDDDWVDFE